MSLPHQLHCRSVLLIPSIDPQCFCFKVDRNERKVKPRPNISARPSLNLRGGKRGFHPRVFPKHTSLCCVCPSLRSGVRGDWRKHVLDFCCDSSTRSLCSSRLTNNTLFHNFLRLRCVSLPAVSCKCDCFIPSASCEAAKRQLKSPRPSGVSLPDFERP